MARELYKVLRFNRKSEQMIGLMNQIIEDASRCANSREVQGVTTFLWLVLFWHLMGFLVDMKGYREASEAEAKHSFLASVLHVVFIVWAACLLS